MPQARRGQQAQTVHKARRELQDLQAHKDCKGLKELQDHKDRLELQGWSTQETTKETLRTGMVNLGKLFLLHRSVMLF